MESYLPNELEREIFELAFFYEKRHSRARLLRVARRLYDWLSPLLYQSIIFEGSIKNNIYDGSKALDLFYRNQHPQGNGFLERTVKSVAFYNIMTRGEKKAIISVLRKCTGVSELMFDRVTGTLDVEVVNTALQLPLRRLYLGGYDARNLCVQAVSLALDGVDFSRLTHLSLVGTEVERSLLSTFSSLTHILFHRHPYSMDHDLSRMRAMIIHLLSRPTIKAVIINQKCGNHNRLGIRDSRLAEIDMERSWLEDWIARSESREDFWDRVDVIMNQRTLFMDVPS